MAEDEGAESKAENQITADKKTAKGRGRGKEVWKVI